MKNAIKISLLLIMAGLQLCLHAQLNVTAQLRTRTELRDGQGAPLPKGTSAAFFTSQRTRLNVLYSTPRLKFFASAQDVRVWGQDASLINRTTAANNNGFMLHQAWAEVLLTDTALKNKALSLKIGRQEIVYDDERLLGGLDWLQQGRRHDAAMLKYETGPWVLHAAIAFNQNQENAAGTVYNSTPAGNYTATTNGGTMYKSMQFLYAGKKLAYGNASFLFFTDQFSKYSMDSATNTKAFKTGTWSRATTGFYLNNTFNRISVTASAYYQFGKTPAGQKLSAALLSGMAQYAFNKKISAGPGIDYTTGGTSGTTSNAFDPLYGTPHKFWGLMDYFYAASPFGKGGLADYYIKSRFTPSAKLWFTADVHQFTSAAKINVGKKSFGQEIDIVGNYSLTKQIILEAGYGHFFNTALLTGATVKNVAAAKSGANWAYLSINIKPELLNSIAKK